METERAVSIVGQDAGSTHAQQFGHQGNGLGGFAGHEVDRGLLVAGDRLFAQSNLVFHDDVLSRLFFRAVRGSCTWWAI